MTSRPVDRAPRATAGDRRSFAFELDSALVDRLERVAADPNAAVAEAIAQWLDRQAAPASAEPPASRSLNLAPKPPAAEKAEQPDALPHAYSRPNLPASGRRIPQQRRPIPRPKPSSAQPDSNSDETGWLV